MSTAQQEFPAEKQTYPIMLLWTRQDLLFNTIITQKKYSCRMRKKTNKLCKYSAIQISYTSASDTGIDGEWEGKLYLLRYAKKVVKYASSNPLNPKLV